MATKRLPNCRVCGHQKQPRKPCLNCIQVARREYAATVADASTKKENIHGR